MIPKNVRVFVCTEPQDMRRGFDRLALAVRAEMGGDPRSGAVFVFLSRRADRLKLLWWDHNGFAVLYKRLHRATTTAPKAASPSQRSIEIDEKSLGALLRGIPRAAGRGRENALDVGARTSSKDA
ncbi:IS66 family insertion sequence element accessory protein TnpB [Nannocystis exedens]|uniref:IS66 family insertion sequence element accessory protein TnpB n=1 Tax=Nannocystis exedens TaxID=54 RepID=UPI000BBA0ACB|nr:IS66 family insertion sequence element accessory protein TnpB [Nannocystis exedens]PCC70110.1 transposase [Nannocystis exedens]